MSSNRFENKPGKQEKESNKRKHYYEKNSAQTQSQPKRTRFDMGKRTHTVYGSKGIDEKAKILLEKFIDYLKNDKLKNFDEIALFYEDVIKTCGTKTIGFSLTMILRHLSSHHKNYSREQFDELKFTENVDRLIEYYLDYRAKILAGKVHCEHKGHELSIEVLMLLIHRLVRLGHGKERLFDFEDLPISLTGYIISEASRCKIGLVEDLGGMFWALGILASDVLDNRENKDYLLANDQNQIRKIHRITEIIKSLNPLDVKFLYSKILDSQRIDSVSIGNLNWGLAKIMAVHEGIKNVISASDIAYAIKKILDQAENINERVLQDTFWMLKEYINSKPEMLTAITPEQIYKLVKVAITLKGAQNVNLMWFLDLAFVQNSSLTSLIKPWHIQQLLIKEADSIKSDTLTATNILLNFSQIIKNDPSFLDELKENEIEDLALAINKILINLTASTNIPANLFQYIALAISHLAYHAQILLKYFNASTLNLFLSKSNMVKSVESTESVNNNFSTKQYFKSITHKEYTYAQGVLLLIDNLLNQKPSLIKDVTLRQIEGIIDTINGQSSDDLPPQKLVYLLLHLMRIIKLGKVQIHPEKMFLLINKLAVMENLTAAQLKITIDALLMLLKDNPSLLSSLKPTLDQTFFQLTRLPQHPDGSTLWLKQFEDLKNLNIHADNFSATEQITTDLAELVAVKGNVIRKLIVAARMIRRNYLDVEREAFRRVVSLSIPTFSEITCAEKNNTYAKLKAIRMIVEFNSLDLVKDAHAVAILSKLITELLSQKLTLAPLYKLVKLLSQANRALLLDESILSLLENFKEKCKPFSHHERLALAMTKLEQALEVSSQIQDISEPTTNSTASVETNNNVFNEVFTTKEPFTAIAAKPELFTIPGNLPNTNSKEKPAKEYEVKKPSDMEQLVKDILETDPKSSFKYDYETNKNRTKHKLLIAPVAILRNQYGVFAKQEIKVDVEKNEKVLLGCYAGDEYILEEEDIDNLYLFPLTNDQEPKNMEKDDADKPERVVDAKKFGDWTRFINHGCTPNVVVEIKNVRGVERIYMYAVRTIKPGEQLIFDYRDEYFEAFGYTPYYMTEKYGSKHPCEIYHQDKANYASHLFSFDADFTQFLQLPANSTWVLPHGFEYIYANELTKLSDWLSQNSNNINLPGFVCAGADFAETQNQPYLSLLAYACYLGNEKAIQMLMEQDSRYVDQPTLIQGQLPLAFLLMGKASDEVVTRVSKQLLQHMNYPFTNDKNKLNLLHYAIKRNLPEVVEAILENAIIRSEDQSEMNDNHNINPIAVEDIFKDMYQRSTDKPPYADLDYCLQQNQNNVLAVILKKLMHYDQFFDGNFFGLVNQNIIFSDKTLNQLSLTALKEFESMLFGEKIYEKILSFTNLSSRITAAIKLKEELAVHAPKPVVTQTSDTICSIAMPSSTIGNVTSDKNVNIWLDLNETPMDGIAHDVFGSETMDPCFQKNANADEQLDNDQIIYIPMSPLDLNAPDPEDTMTDVQPHSPLLIHSEDTSMTKRIECSTISIESFSLFKQTPEKMIASPHEKELSVYSRKFAEFSKKFMSDEQLRSRFLRESARGFKKYLMQMAPELTHEQSQMLSDILTQLMKNALSLYPKSKYVLNDITEFNLQIVAENVIDQHAYFNNAIQSFSRTLEDVLLNETINKIYKKIASRCTFDTQNTHQLRLSTQNNNQHKDDESNTIHLSQPSEQGRLQHRSS